MRRLATCSCGKLTVSCAGEPTKVSLCHCRECQKRTGSSYGIAAFFRRSDLEVRGENRLFTRQADSGFEVAFHFCPQCGSTVYWEPRRMPDLIAVAVGAFADPSFPRPSQQVYQETCHPWVSVAD